MYSPSDIAEYYETTHVHYEKWWNLKESLSLHYGLWEKDTKSFAEAIQNTNKLLLKTSGISATDKVLDAGCGVGGAALFVAKTTGANVTGLSLSQKQISLAKEMAIKNQVEDRVDFQLMDFTNTSFPPESFDVIWACESVCHVPDKNDFIRECYRLLKKGGRVVLFDFFLSEQNQIDKSKWIDKWCSTWAVPNFETVDYFKTNFEEIGFKTVKSWDYTDQIQKSAKRMYYASLLGAIPSEFYNLLNPKVSRFAKDHYKCGYYQYKALKENLWRYNMILATKDI